MPSAQSRWSLAYACYSCGQHLSNNNNSCLDAFHIHPHHKGQNQFLKEYCGPEGYARGHASSHNLSLQKVADKKPKLRGKKCEKIAGGGNDHPDQGVVQKGTLRLPALIVIIRKLRMWLKIVDYVADLGMRDINFCHIHHFLHILSWKRGVAAQDRRSHLESWIGQKIAGMAKNRGLCRGRGIAIFWG